MGYRGGTSLRGMIPYHITLTFRSWFSFFHSLHAIVPSKTPNGPLNGLILLKGTDYIIGPERLQILSLNHYLVRLSIITTIHPQEREMNKGEMGQNQKETLTKETSKPLCGLCVHRVLQAFTVCSDPEKAR